MWDNLEKVVAGDGNFLPWLDIIPCHKLGRQVKVVTPPNSEHSPVLCYGFTLQLFLPHRLSLFSI